VQNAKSAALFAEVSVKETDRAASASEKLQLSDYFTGNFEKLIGKYAKFAAIFGPYVGQALRVRA